MIKLNKLTSIITKGTTPVTYEFDFLFDKVNFIKSECLINKPKIDTSKVVYIDKLTNEKLQRSILKENDVLMSIAGYLGNLAIVTNDILPANINQAIAIIRCNPILVLPQYLFYYLSTSKMKNIINNYNAQSAQPNINLTQVGDLDIFVASMSQQQHIVNILGLLVITI